MANIKFELDRLNQTTTDAELIADIRRVATELGQTTVTISQYEKAGKFNASTPKRRFGSWSAVLEKAGFQKVRAQRNSRIPNEDLFKNIEEAWIKLGRQPRMTEMFEPLSKYSADVYKRRFGSWMKALSKFVSTINSEETTPAASEAIATAGESTARHKTQRHVNWRLRFLAMRQDNFKCRACGRSPANTPGIILEIDHIKAWAKGGETVLENLQALCSQCNNGKSNLEATG